MSLISERLNAIAMQMAGPVEESVSHNTPEAIQSYIRDMAYAVSHIAQELEQVESIAGDLQATDGEFPTPRQGLALARFMRQVMRDDSVPIYRYARVSRGGAGLGDDYLYVALGDNYVGGIDREGRVST